MPPHRLSNPLSQRPHLRELTTKTTVVNQEGQSSKPVCRATRFGVRTHRPLVNHAFPRFRPKMAGISGKVVFPENGHTTPHAELATARPSLSHSLHEPARLVNGAPRRCISDNGMMATTTTPNII